MAQASLLLRQKAKEYNIDIDESTALWAVRVCKRMLEGYLSLLKLSHEKVIPGIDRMEEELLAIKNFFEDLRGSSDGDFLMKEGYIRSIIEIVNVARKAYIKISVILAQSKAKKNAEDIQKQEDKAAGKEVIARYLEDISQYLFEYQDIIEQVLTCFGSKV